jgi:hypothetical protein
VVRQDSTPDNSDNKNSRKLHLRVVGVHDGDTITGLDESKTCAPTTTNLDGPDSLAGGPCSSRFKGGWLWLGR